MAGALKMRKTSRQSPKGQGNGQGDGQQTDPSHGLGSNPSYAQATGTATGGGPQGSDELTAQEMFWDVLGTEKQLAQLCNRAALEAGQPGLYQDLMAILNETQACHRELFHVMLQRGWYHLHPADLMQTQQVFHDFHSMAQSLNNQNQGNQGEPGQSTQSGGNGAASGGSASGGSGNTSGGSSSGGSGGN